LFVKNPGSGHLVMDNLSDHDTDDVNQWFRRTSALDQALHPDARFLAQPDRECLLDAPAP
jgi:hypothetical protein